VTVLEVARAKTEWNFTFYGGLKSPVLLSMGPKQFLKSHNCQGLCQTVRTSLSVLFYMSKTSCSTKQWLNKVHVLSWTFLTFSKLPKQTETVSETISLPFYLCLCFGTVTFCVL